MKLIPNSQSWSEFPRPSLWLFLFENGCTNISNLCTTPIATCPSCRAVHYKYSCWVSPHMHRLTASCCLWHTALHWHHLHLHAVENSPDRHCFCSFSHKSIAVGQQMPPSHLQVHTPTCTMPLLSRCLGKCLVGHTSSPEPAWLMQRHQNTRGKAEAETPSLSVSRSKVCPGQFPGSLSFISSRASSHPWSKVAPFYNTTAMSHKAFSIFTGVWKSVRQ